MIKTKVAIFAGIGLALVSAAMAADGPPPLPGDVPGAIVAPAPEKLERVEPTRPVKKVPASTSAKARGQASKDRISHARGRSAPSSKSSGKVAAGSRASNAKVAKILSRTVPSKTKPAPKKHTKR